MAKTDMFDPTQNVSGDILSLGLAWTGFSIYRVHKNIGHRSAAERIRQWRGSGVRRDVVELASVAHGRVTSQQNNREKTPVCQFEGLRTENTPYSSIMHLYRRA